MCTAAKKLKDSLFSVVVAKAKGTGFNLKIRTECFVMQSKQPIEGQMEEGCNKDEVEVTLKGSVFTSLFKVMTIAGTGFISKLLGKRRAEG